MMKLFQNMKIAILFYSPLLLKDLVCQLLRAQAIGRPVVTSNLEPMLWTAGKDAAIFVDPYDHISIRQGIELCINNSDLRKSIVENGKKNTLRFSVKKISSMYLGLNVK